MVASSYDAALARVLAHEGGYSNHPADPGGVTLEGVTQAVYDDYRRSKGLPREALLPSMRGKPAWIAARDAIYRARYWDVLRCDALPSGVDYAMFDYGVNSGVARAAKALQRLVGVDVDGAIGPLTLAALATHRPAALVAALCDERLAFLKSLKTWPVFGAGWSRRVADVRRVALAMTDATSPAVAPALATATMLTGVAAAAAQGIGNSFAVVLTVIAAAGFIGVCGWFAWRRSRQQEET
ncbi:MAG TPA: glycosyl hydrolase 108 family protein [Pseudolabrys sp.]|nr:glycosyl hydrolase 108 family protein [Pseudolabrys sp.]